MLCLSSFAVGDIGWTETWSRYLSHYQGWESGKVDFRGKVEMALVLLHDLCEQQCSLISSRDPEDDGAGYDEDDGNVIR